MNHRYVVLIPSASAQPEGYDVRLGPLSFVTPADVVSETVGDGLEAVGAALVAAERAPRPLKLKLPVRGYHRDSDPKQSGLRLRRQVRAVLDNARWRLSGFYFVWDPDPDMDGWLMVGSAEIGESDPGISFGEYDLDLADVFIVGRPGTHRPARRAKIGDRRTGLVARDSRRLVYSTDFDTQPLPDEPLVLPGDVVDLVASGNRPVGSVALGPLRDARRLWRAVSASDAEILSYLPDEAILPGRERYLDLDDLGSVRVWDLSSADPYPPDPAGYTPERDTDPNLYWGWERVLGDVLTADRPLALDNGVCRLVWLGAAANQGLAVEHWDDVAGHYVRAGRVLHALSVREQRIVELTPERAVVEWRAGQYGLRAILQRGWWGPRLESYNDDGGTARLEYAPQDGAPTVTAQTPTWVRAVEPAGIVAITNRATNPSGETAVKWSDFDPDWTITREIEDAAVPAWRGDYRDKHAYDGAGAGSNMGSIFEHAFPQAGQWCVSTYVWIPAAYDGSGIRLRVDASFTGHTGLVTVPADMGLRDQWQRIYTSLTVAAGDLTGSFVLRSGAGGEPGPTSAETGVFYTDAVQIESGTAPTEYFDGASAGARWAGTPHASTSELLEQEPVDLLWASGSADETVDTSPVVITGPAAGWERDRALVAQLAPAARITAAELAALSLVDARPVPVLVGRG